MRDRRYLIELIGATRSPIEVAIAGALSWNEFLAYCGRTLLDRLT
jgi:hypothetical protein